MAKVIGYDPAITRRFTCPNCGAIVEYTPSEVLATDRRDEGVQIMGLKCPGCGEFQRTNP